MLVEQLFEVSVKPSHENPYFQDRKAAGAEYLEDGRINVWYLGRLEHEKIHRPGNVVFLAPEESGSHMEETRVTYFPGEAHILKRPNF